MKANMSLKRWFASHIGIVLNDCDSTLMPRIFFRLALIRKYRSPIFISSILRSDMSLSLSYLDSSTKLNYVGQPSNRRFSALWKQSSACTGWSHVQWGLTFLLTRETLFSCSALSLAPDLSKSSLCKVVRWMVRLCAYNYICVHCNGQENVWADLLSQWCPSPIVRCLIKIPPLLSANAPDFKWPSRESIEDEQSKEKTATKLSNERQTLKNAK